MQSSRHPFALPTEVLMEIFSYVPNKKPLKLTCAGLYETICKLEEQKLRLVLKDVRKTQKDKRK